MMLQKITRSSQARLASVRALFSTGFHASVFVFAYPVRHTCSSIPFFRSRFKVMCARLVLVARIYSLLLTAARPPIIDLAEIILATDLFVQPDTSGPVLKEALNSAFVFWLNNPWVLRLVFPFIGSTYTWNFVRCKWDVVRDYRPTIAGSDFKNQAVLVLYVARLYSFAAQLSFISTLSGWQALIGVYIRSGIYLLFIWLLTLLVGLDGRVAGFYILFTSYLELRANSATAQLLGRRLRSLFQEGVVIRPGTGLDLRQAAKAALSKARLSPFKWNSTSYNPLFQRAHHMYGYESVRQRSQAILDGDQLQITHLCTRNAGVYMDVFHHGLGGPTSKARLMANVDGIRDLAASTKADHSFRAMLGGTGSHSDCISTVTAALGLINYSANHKVCDGQPVRLAGLQESDAVRAAPGKKTIGDGAFTLVGDVGTDGRKSENVRTYQAKLSASEDVNTLYNKAKKTDSHVNILVLRKYAPAIQNFQPHRFKRETYLMNYDVIKNMSMLDCGRAIKRQQDRELLIGGAKTFQSKLPGIWEDKDPALHPEKRRAKFTACDGRPPKTKLCYLWLKALWRRPPKSARHRFPVTVGETPTLS